MSEITHEIRAYRDGKIPFAQLVEELGTRTYKTPSRYNDPLHGTLEADGLGIGGEGYPEEGTWDEVVSAQNTGLLSRDEFYAISEAAWEYHTEKNKKG